MSIKNRIKHFYSFLKKDPSKVFQPTELHIAINSGCNLNCLYCPRESIPHQPSFMGMHSFKSIFNIIKPQFVSLNFYNEPLLHPKLPEMISFLKSINIYSSIETNGILLNPETSVSLLSSGIDQLIVSIDAYSEKTYKLIRGGDFNKVIKNTLRLIEISKKYNSSIAVQFLESSENSKEIKDFKKFWESKNIQVKIKPMNSRAGLLESNHIRQNACFRIYSSMAIHTDGDISPCCVDFSKKYILGNIFTDNPIKLIKNKKLFMLRKLHFEKRFPDLCKKCDKDDLPHAVSSLILLSSPRLLRWISRKFKAPG